MSKRRRGEKNMDGKSVGLVAEQQDQLALEVVYEGSKAFIKRGTDGVPIVTPREPLERWMGRTRSHFSDVYLSLWNLLHLDRRVEAAVDAAVKKEADKHWTGFKTYALTRMSDEERKAFSESINAELTDPLRELSGKLNEEFSKCFRQDIVNYYRDAIAANLESASPVEAAYVRQFIEEELDFSGAQILDEVGRRTKETGTGVGNVVKGSIMAASAPLVASGAGALVSAMTSTPGMLASLFGAKATLLGSTTLAAWGPGVAAALGPAGIAVGVTTAIYGLWKYSGAMDEFVKQTKDALKEHFKKQLPKNLWAEMAAYVKGWYLEAAANLQMDFNIARQIVAFPVVEQQLEGLSEIEKTRVVKRFATLIRSLGVRDERSVAAFLEDWGKHVGSVSESQFQRLLPVIKENSLKTRQWIDLLGAYEYFQLEGTLPRRAWELFEPTMESVALLGKISRMASASQERAAAQSPNDLKWVFGDGLAEDHRAELFGASRTPGEICAEIARLRRIPFNSFRCPWMGPFEYKIVRYGLLVVAVLVILAVFKLIK